jgi:hypothetical protein
VGRPESDSPLNYNIMKCFIWPALTDTRKDIVLRPGYRILSACFGDTEIALS